MFIPKVSIIIPVYNGGNYLREAILSALAQTYSNIEIIVVNDGSNDNGKTRNIALAFKDTIHYIEKENGGVSTALNEGIAQMTGEYFSWLSHDDRYKPDKIKSQIELLSQLEDKTTIIYSGYELIDETGKMFCEVRPGKRWPKEQLDNPLFPVFKGLLNGCSLLIHRSHFERVGGFDPLLAASQDIDLWYRMLRSGGKICYQDAHNVQTRIHQKQDTNKGSSMEEVNKGWIQRMHEVTEEEMTRIMGSPLLFYKGIAETLKPNKPYEPVYKEAVRMMQSYEEKEVREPLVTVVIPFYERVWMTKEAVESVLNQTYKHLEILLINDGSEGDLTPLLELEQRQPRLKIIHESHRGSGAARNKGIELAKGEYIAFLDSDDLWLPQKIEKQLEFMQEKGLVFSHTSYTRITAKGEVIKNMDSASIQQGNIFPQVLHMCCIATPTVMVKRSAIGDLRFPVGVKVSQDICFWIDLAYHYELGGLTDYLSKVRMTNTTTCLDNEKVKQGYYNILTHIIHHPEYAKENKAIKVLLENFARLYS